MAPRKKADEKASGNEAVDMVLHYLRKQNRPYSAIDVSANLHNKVTKAAAAKILKDLHEQKHIEGRLSGKQIVYHALQDPSDSCTPEQLAAMDTRIADLRAQTAQLTASAKALRTTLSELNSELSTADLISNVQMLQSEKAEILARLEGLKAGKAKKITREQRERVDREWKANCAVAKRREKIVRDMWAFVEEHVPEKEMREELRERLGLDE